MGKGNVRTGAGWSDGKKEEILSNGFQCFNQIGDG